MNAPRRPVLVVNPIDDRQFVAAAEGILDEGIVELDEFRARLHNAYPDARVHPREISAEPVLIWYVYRDGRWVNPAGAEGGSGTSSVDDQSARRSQGYGAVDPS
jgi:hypothetical protein